MLRASAAADAQAVGPSPIKPCIIHNDKCHLEAFMSTIIEFDYEQAHQTASMLEGSVTDLELILNRMDESVDSLLSTSTGDAREGLELDWREYLAEFRRLNERLINLSDVLHRKARQFEEIGSLLGDVVRVVHDNKELLVALVGLATPIVQYFLNKKKANKDDQNIKLRIELGDAIFELKEKEVCDEQELLTELLSKDPEITQKLTKSSRVKIMMTAKGVFQETVTVQLEE